MINKIDFEIPELLNMKKYPNDLYYIGDTNLLQKTKVSIVGSRSPNQYSRNIIAQISNNVIYKNKLKSTTINLNGGR